MSTSTAEAPAHLLASPSAAPTPPPAAIGPRQALADQRVADVAAVDRHVAQLAAVDVLVAADARQANSGSLGPPPPFISGVSAQRLCIDAQGNSRGIAGLAALGS
jgi:hypothetical protein